MRTEIIYTYIAEDGKRFTNEKDCREYESHLTPAKEEERQIAEKEFFIKLGLAWEDTADFRRMINNVFIIIDRFGNFVKLVTVNPGTDDYDKLLKENRKQDTFGHNLSCFCDRNKAFYEMSYIQQFENLCWGTTSFEGHQALTDAWGGRKRREYTACSQTSPYHYATFLAANKSDAKELVKSYNKFFSNNYKLV